MSKLLVDTGPLIAWFDRSDNFHDRCRSFFSSVDRPLLTTWPVLTEVCHLIPSYGVNRFMRWVALGGLEVQELGTTAITGIANLMERYSDIPMDLADASLVWVAGQWGLSEIVTLDRRDFGIYRLPGGEALINQLFT
ncbi:type II toxin-antitoxin system VapC family toxin [Synechococcus elongatus]|uniref:PIN domain-containing protein n=2 Tax=Synechococcus elongatus TaxID=32046 RepID=Q31L92_SYNE7|nr:PIN domain-containing protein [Synechococcus elongatus]ABB58177.1 conserved hypothetical protein [Synechococcus elongatus PCC 7942 = FACHB-805]AJD57346.1 hypothetical protein M744_05620 [Synechococcus elongatus UTEX 2973]MBD2586900.1 PIN domain-containing protein [Synechococcus elongatus FACHB-242]MBD2687971.1 PIN domain-containing protein [Synechococcus elongatus FACHB-1061]MBD2706318.1 PIN domain-containing protein [Synechococcus elongatus PCC 7942 = FACHB-805]